MLSMCTHTHTDTCHVSVKWGFGFHLWWPDPILLLLLIIRANSEQGIVLCLLNVYRLPLGSGVKKAYYKSI